MDPEVLKNMGVDAEVEYLRRRNKQLEEIIEQQSRDLQKQVTEQTDQKTQLQIAVQQRDKLQKQFQQS